MFRPFSLVCLACFVLWAACTRQTTSSDTALIDYFPKVNPGDTLHLELPDEQDTTITGKVIPTPLFFKILGPLMKPVEHVVDSSLSEVMALQRFPLNKNYDVCVVQLDQFWFKHQSALLFDKQKQRFTDRITVAEWYGGDGGQILTGSWFFDYNGDGNKDFVRRYIEHRLYITPDNVAEDQLAESAELLLWSKNTWVKTPVKDSSLLVKSYPIRSVW